MAWPVWIYYAIVAVVSYAAASWMAPDAPKQDGGGTNITKPDTDAMEAVIYGEMGRVSGTIQHLATNDADSDDIKNDLLHMIITWGEAVSKIVEVYVDDIAASSTAWNDNKTPGNRWLYCSNYISGLRIISARLLELTGFDVARHKFTEKAVSYIRCEWDNGTRFNGKPNCLAHVKGRVIWDPRTDTLAWSDNPALCLLDYLTNVRYGKGMLLEDIDVDSFKVAADICETQVETEIGSGEYQNLFTCNIRIDTTSTVKTNVDTLLKGCRGLLPEINGITTLIIEQDDAVTPDSITEDLIIGDIKIKESGTNDRYNRVIVSFIDKEQNWKSQEAIWPDTAQHNIFKAEDNDKLLEKKITLETSTDHNEARQMARILCLLSREALSGTIVCAPECIKFTVGDIVPISHTSTMWSDKPFRITNVDYHKEGNVTLHIREHQPYIYNWDGVIRSIPDVVYNDPRIVQSPTGLALLPLSDSKLEFSWESSRSNFIVNVYNADNVVVLHGTPNEKKFIIENLAQGSYSAEVAAVSGIGYESDWSVIQFNILLPTVPGITVDSISDDSVSLSATVGGLPSLETTFLWQFLGSSDNVITGKIVKGDIFTYTGLLPETTYNFKCRTVNISGESDWVEISATTLESNALVSNISFEQLDANLASFVNVTNRDLVQLTADMTEAKLRDIYQLNRDSEATIDLQTKTVQIDSAESLISNLVIQSSNFTSVLNQITHSSNGILAQANDYTYSGIGYWIGNTWREGALSERLRNVRVETSNGYAKVSEIAQAFEDVDGVFVAQGGMITDVNNRVGGFMTYNNGETTQFDVIASSFRLGEYVGGNINNAFETYLYAQSGQLIVDKSWIRAEALVVGTGITTMLGGKPTLLNQHRTNIGTGYMSLSDVDNQPNISMTSYGQINVTRGYNGQASLVFNDTATYPSGVSVWAKSGAGAAVFSDGVGDFTAQHPYLITKKIGANPVGLLISEGHVEERVNLSSALSYSSLSQQSRDRKAVGVASRINRLAVSSNAQTLDGICLAREVELKDTYNQAYVNALGDGLMWVCSEAGDIEQGQWLCSSSTQGYAMLQTDVNTGDYEKYFTDYTVAKSRESVVWDNEPNNTKLIAVYYKGG